MTDFKYCLQCNEIKLTFAKGGLFKEDATYLQFIQNGETVLMRKLDYIPKGDLTIGLTAFVPVDVCVSGSAPKGQDT